MALNKNSGGFVCVTGYIVRHGRQSQINAPRAGIFWVQWLDGKVPAGIGARVTIIGELVTFDLGRAFKIINAQCLTITRMAELKQFLLKS